MPRLPDDFTAVEAKAYPVVTLKDGKRAQVKVDYAYERTGNGYRVLLNAHEPLAVNRVRFGPFPQVQPALRAAARCGGARRWRPRFCLCSCKPHAG